MKQNKLTSKYIIPLTLRIIFIIAPLFFVLGWGYFLNQNITELKRIIHKETVDNYSPDLTDDILTLKSIKEDSLSIIIQKKDFERLNNRLKEITKVINKQFQLSEDRVNNDLNRLNIYISVGIGLLALIGVFVPIMSSFMSVSDLKEKLENLENGTIGEIKEKIKKLEEEIIAPASKNANDALNDSNTAKKLAEEALNKSEKIGDIEEKINKITPQIESVRKTIEDSIPKVDTLVIQSAIGRFFNMSPYILSTSIGTNEEMHLVDVLNSIKEGFNSCLNLKKYPAGDEFLKTTIQDFRIALKRRYITSAFNKKVLNEFETLAQHLALLENVNTESEILEIYKKIVQTFENIISELKLSIKPL
ncbi:MAG: hypothetical protein WAR79_00340 [Melioribacteraceae bacterium]